MKTIMKAIDRILDSVWTLTYELNEDNSMTILDYNRDDVEGYEKEDILPKCRKHEENNRIVTSVIIREKGKSAVLYAVKNPMHVFKYNSIARAKAKQEKQ